MSAAKRYICIHGHFYQPPRESPWLAEIENQESAAPYHDWNERILAECYRSNATSRILDDQDRITSIVNNYASISFNFGPTLLEWLEDKAPRTYAAILEADRESMLRFGGHGSALAQAYNHMIMPLANQRDIDTQVRWGIEDFRHRFRRDPQGMWLPETAVDLRTLESLAAHGIRFTILEPGQAARFRQIGDEQWTETEAIPIDTKHAYTVNLPSGNNLALFFYDGPVSRAVAFEKLLDRGEKFAERLTGAFEDEIEGPQLVHIATDGETYGHHHRFGDMALAFALHHIEEGQLAELTNYGQFLELHPPCREVEIRENTAWSCAHGTGRWQSDCGCSTGAHAGWNQEWREPLRKALDHLRDKLAPLFEKEALRFFQDPWAARNGYIQVVLDSSPETVDRFLEEYARRRLDGEDRRQCLELMELQRQLQRMYTSCGWFFDDIAGIETVQILQYAGRAIQLAEQLFDDSFLPSFLDILESARGNTPKDPNGRTVFEHAVQPRVVDLSKVGAHFAAASLFEELADNSEIFRYSVQRTDRQSLPSGKTRLQLSRILVTDQLTTESADLACCAFHLGDHNLVVGVREFQGQEPYEVMVEEIRKLFHSADTPGVMRAIDRHFPAGTLTLQALFRDEQKKVVDKILENTLSDATTVYRSLYRQHAPLMRFLAELDVTPPGPLHATADFVLNSDLQHELRSDQPDKDRIRSVLQEIDDHKATLDEEQFRFDLEGSIVQFMRKYYRNPYDRKLLNELVEYIRYILALEQTIDLRSAGDLYHDLLKQVLPHYLDSNASPERKPAEWIESFTCLGELLGFRLQPPQQDP